MPSLPLISTPISEHWTAWVMLFLLVTAILANQRQNGLFKSSFRSLFSKMKRSYSEANSDLLDTIYIGIFRIGTLAMTLYASLFHGPEFNFLTYLMIVGIILLAEALRMMLIQVVRYIFSLFRTTDQLMNQYASLWVALTVAVYPITLLIINFGTDGWIGVLNYTLLAIIAAAYIIILTIKLVRALFAGPLTLLYIPLYICTLEVLPITAVIIGVKALLTYNF